MSGCCVRPRLPAERAALNAVTVLFRATSFTPFTFPSGRGLSADRRRGREGATGRIGRPLPAARERRGKGKDGAGRRAAGTTLTEATPNS